MNKSTLFIALLVAATSCNTGNKKPSGNTETAVVPFSKIAPPVANVKPDAVPIPVANASGAITKTNRGTIVIIPENAFTYEDGTPIKGYVNVELEEVFSESEIMLSGIPMNVENNGVIQPFISDGMFKITATCEDKTAVLAKDKTITICNESKKADTDFDYWYFDEKSGKWQGTGDREQTYTSEDVMEKASEINPTMASAFKNDFTKITSIQSGESDKSTSNKEEAPEKPAPPASYKDGDFVFTLLADYNEYPELKEYKNILWKPIADYSEGDRKVLKARMQSAGANIELKKVNEELDVYEVLYGNTSVQVMPVYTGKDKKVADAAYQEKLKAYVAKVKDNETYKASAQRVAAQSNKLYNMFTVNKMGVYNCDRFYNYNGPKQQFVFSRGTVKSNENVFAVLKGDQGVINLTASYRKGEYYELANSIVKGFIQLDGDGKVYGTKFDKDKAEQVNKIELEPLKAELTSPKDLQKIVDSF